MPPIPPTPRTLRIALLFLIAIYLINFLFLGFLIGPFDYDHLSGYYELAWRFWHSQSSLPHYNPYLCGGRTLGGDPQIPIFHPFTLLVPLFGPTLLLKIEMLAQLALGAWGLDRLLRRFDINDDARAWGLLAYLAGGGVVARFLVGHVTLGFYFLYPLFLYLSYRLTDPSPAPHRRVLAAYLVLFVYSSLYKPNFFIYGLPPLFFEALARSLFSRDRRPLVFLVLASATAALVGAVSWLPAWKYFHDFPRIDDTVPHLVAPYALVANLLLPLKTLPEFLYGPGFMQRHEYNIFLGPLALYFAWRGFRSLRAPHLDEKRAIVCFLLFSAWLGLGAPEGSLGVLFPYHWLEPVWPGFRSIRVPVRFWYGAFTGLVLLSAMGFRSPTTRRGSWTLLLVGILPLVIPSTVNLFRTSVQAREVQWSPPREYPPQVLQVAPEVHSGFPHLRRGESLLECFRNLENHQSPALRVGRALTPLDPFDGKLEARFVDWHRISLRAEARAPFVLRLDFNHSPYWHFDGQGATIVSRLGEPLTMKSEGQFSGELRFEQPWEREAALVSLISTVLFIGALVVLLATKEKIA